MSQEEPKVLNIDELDALKEACDTLRKAGLPIGGALVPSLIVTAQRWYASATRRQAWNAELSKEVTALSFGLPIRETSCSQCESLVALSSALRQALDDCVAYHDTPWEDKTDDQQFEVMKNARQAISLAAPEALLQKQEREAKLLASNAALRELLLEAIDKVPEGYEILRNRMEKASFEEGPGADLLNFMGHLRTALGRIMRDAETPSSGCLMCGNDGGHHDGCSIEPIFDLLRRTPLQDTELEREYVTALEKVSHQALLLYRARQSSEDGFQDLMERLGVELGNLRAIKHRRTTT